MLALGIIGAMANLPLETVKEAVGIPEFNLVVGLITIMILGSIGFLAGYFPARRASRLNVVECLRY
jgi:putative ABC transport system permease protein